MGRLSHYLQVTDLNWKAQLSNCMSTADRFRCKQDNHFPLETLSGGLADRKRHAEKQGKGKKKKRISREIFCQNI